MENPNEEYKIVKDLNRTLPQLNLFTEEYQTGNNKLFNLLKAYSCYDHNLGYVQGMNYLAAILLIHIQDEVKAFWCLVYLLFRKNWRRIYDNNTPKLMSLLEIVQMRLMKDDPELLDHLESEGVQMEAAFSPLFITIFIYSIPISIATRIFEYFIVEGETALLKVLFRLLEWSRDKLMGLRD